MVFMVTGKIYTSIFCDFVDYWNAQRQCTSLEAVVRLRSNAIIIETFCYSRFLPNTTSGSVCPIPSGQTLFLERLAYFCCYELSKVLLYLTIWMVKVKVRIYQFVIGITTPLLEITCHKGSHSVTCHPAAVTSPPLPQPKLVLDLATRRDARLSWPGWWLYCKIVSTCMVVNFNLNCYWTENLEFSSLSCPRL